MAAMLCHHWNQCWLTINKVLWHSFQGHFYLTQSGRDKMDAISQRTFSSAFSWMKMFQFRLKFHWSLFLRVQLTILQHWHRPGDKPLSEPMLVSLPTCICFTPPQWVKYSSYQSPSCVSNLPKSLRGQWVKPYMTWHWFYGIQQIQ